MDALAVLWVLLQAGNHHISITNGNIPIVCLFEDGKLVKEYDVFTIDEREITDFLLPR